MPSEKHKRHPFTIAALGLLLLPGVQHPVYLSHIQEVSSLTTRPLTLTAKHFAV